MRCALYVRVSTVDQTVQNQVLELRQFAAARGWAVVAEFSDVGVSGAKDRRPALDDLIAAARRRRFDVLLVWKLDRLGRSLRHLIFLVEELQAIGVGFVSMGEGLDTTHAAGKLQFHLLGAFAQFERERIAERVRAGMARAKAQGRHVGRKRKAVTDAEIAALGHLSVRQAATQLGLSKSFVSGWRASRRVVETLTVSA